ncbi:aminotransferase class V-fold PLP-dependent enzyme [Mariniblastus fucicola]|uniref:Isopenicillin N epimerase n=1 Tax=Mariniblastus fucicola TaxID=980251 RepID=A0A5B9P627_9BACT|nr:aminotransferase class V-fold PLP-dependent enzyme [Mariniblastus fucicola]QEG20969.1 Isopenicillin N epimerase [Mariniblastus fucicola]
MNTTTESTLDPGNEAHWARFRHEFRVRADTVYLNHGSFGIALNKVRYRRDLLLRQLEIQPMDFFLRAYEPLLMAARQRLAEFIGTEAENLAFVDNATYAMNVVANSAPLEPGDEVLLTDQEYGAVKRIWEKKARETGIKIVQVALPEKIESQQQVVDLILQAVTPKTKLVIFSHIVSVSALILPAKAICDALRERNVLSCIDGPHAPMQIDVKLNQIGCDYYTASLHKWLCAPLGTGFLFVRASMRESVNAPITGWGRLDNSDFSGWEEEQFWLGTRNQTGALAVPEAISFFAEIGFENVRQRIHHLASVAESELIKLLGTGTIASRADGFYGSMAHVQLPDGDWSKLQEELWIQEGIEVPVWELNGKWWIRVSCHLYNSVKEIELLVAELEVRL